MEVVALPAESRPEPLAPEDGKAQVVARAPRPGPKTRATARLEKAQAAAYIALRAVSSYSDRDGELPDFFGGLTETIAGLVKARRAAFWRLGPERILAIQPEPHGFPGSSSIRGLRLPVDGNRLVEHAVFADELELVNGTIPELDQLWLAVGLTGIRSSVAVPWRAGDRRIGILAAYDSRRGFTSDDVWVLHVAAMGTGLMWQHREAQQKLDTTVQRLEQAAAARRLLLGNIAAGGDEARRRFASALHDDSLQLLTGAELQLERIEADGDSEKQPAQLEQLKQTLKQVEESLRRLLLNVSSEAGDVPMGLEEAIRTRLEALRTRSGIETDIDLRLPSLATAIETAIFKNISEAVTNVEKHAHATRVRLSAYPSDGGIRVAVSDDGTGFVVAESMHVPGHLGLTAIRERAQFAGGRCRIESEPGAGARVEFWVPINQ